MAEMPIENSRSGAVDFFDSMKRPASVRPAGQMQAQLLLGAPVISGYDRKIRMVLLELSRSHALYQAEGFPLHTKRHRGHRSSGMRPNA
jgi:hypothetical protein